VLRNRFTNTYHTTTVFIALFALFLSSCQKNDIKQIASFSHPPGAPEIVAENLEILYSDSAIVQFQLNCPILKVYSDEKEPFQEYPEGFKMQQFDKTGKVTTSIKADYGKHYENKNLWEAKQNVVVVTLAGDTLMSELLYWDEKKDLLYSDQFVKLIKKDKILTGVGFESSLKVEKWIFYQPRGPITIEVEE